MKTNPAFRFFFRRRLHQPFQDSGDPSESFANLAIVQLDCFGQFLELHDEFFRVVNGCRSRTKAP
jgi:hypothetical protein